VFKDCPKLSDDAKPKELREKIVDVARNERNGLLMIPLGVFLFCAGLILGVRGRDGLAIFGGIFVNALGFFSTLFGFYVAVYYAHEYNDLLREAEGRL
jgi:hypothetical protein